MSQTRWIFMIIFAIALTLASGSDRAEKKTLANLTTPPENPDRIIPKTINSVCTECEDSEGRKYCCAQ